VTEEQQEGVPSYWPRWALAYLSLKAREHIREKKKVEAENVFGAMEDALDAHEDDDPTESCLKLLRQADIELEGDLKSWSLPKRVRAWWIKRHRPYQKFHLPALTRAAIRTGKTRQIAAQIRWLAIQQKDPEIQAEMLLASEKFQNA
jgi:hypothetical protein